MSHSHEYVRDDENGMQAMFLWDYKLYILKNKEIQSCIGVGVLKQKGKIDVAK